MPISNYPAGFAGGVSIRGVPLLLTHPGNVFWVHSGTGSDGNRGTFDRPFATLDYAIGRCTAGRGDVIMVKAGHSETITGAGGITADVAGIAIIGLGSGSSRPSFLMDGAATVTMLVTAANVSMANLVFKAGHADVVTCIGVTAADLHVNNCEFVNNVADENFVIEISATGGDGTADGLKVTDCRAITVDAAGGAFIAFTGDADRVTVQGNFISKDAATACYGITCATGKDLTNAWIEGNRLVTGATANPLLVNSDTTANSGIVANNLIGHHDTAAEVLADLTGARLFQNYGTAVDDASGFLLPAVDS